MGYLTVQITETEDRMVIARGWESGGGEWELMDTEFQFGKIKESSGGG